MTAPRPKVLGLAASLRNARWGAGNDSLIADLHGLPDKPALLAYLTKQSERHLENFLEAGRREGKDFLEIYKNLNKATGDAGLSNSEVALAAALWAAFKEGSEISHLSLAEFFTATGDLRRPDVLRRRLLDADAILLSGPVYFGDRGSLAESLVDFIGRDAGLCEALAGRLYGGIAVGAKRNGGQETTLIYQMIDMLGLGMLAVGNDSDTTAQYGGTGHAGDVGTMHKDLYGIDTSMGVGRRIARVALALAQGERLADRPRVAFLILQDVDGIAERTTDEMIRRMGTRIHPTVVNLTTRRIKRCLACDICPTHIATDDVYRCIITSASDDLSELHAELIEHDMLVPVVATSRDRTRVVSNYQTFIERTRYIRRGDYIWSDLLVVPLALTEGIAYDSYPIRMLTSFLRHHTVLSQPLVARIVGGDVEATDDLVDDLAKAVSLSERLVAGRLLVTTQPDHRYNPVGYVLSANKDAEDEKLQRRRAMIEDRARRAERQASTRIATPQTKGNAVGS
jgi:multimeric flavodoxin WrbA